MVESSDPRVSERRVKLIEIPAADLETLQQLRDDYRVAESWQHAQQIGPLRQWTGTRARVIGSWIANSLGAPKLARTLHTLAWRNDKTDAEAAACRAHELFHDFGPLAAREFLNRLPPTVPHRPEAEVYLHTIQALAAAQFRDFESSTKWLARANEIAADQPWISVTRAYVLEREDRYEEAFAAAQASLKSNPDYRAGLHALSHCLRLLNRDDEAEAVLNRGAAATNHASLWSELALLQLERNNLDTAAASLDRFVAAAPLMEKALAEWVRGHRLVIACRRKDWESARALVREFKDPYHTALAQRLDSAESASRRVQLHVNFVRQHHATCAPATLSALSAFWGKPCEHTELAEAICYDGTPAHSERKWAADNGWLAREFTITWESALALLNRGIPFTLTTSEATSAHLQAVTGYDELRGTFIIRDPFRYSETEFPAEQLFERYRATGPRGMVFVPIERADTLNSLKLPDSEHYDRYNEVVAGLERHDRPAAETALRAMQAIVPEHRLTLSAQRSLASYDANTPMLLAVVERLLERFPKDGNLLLTRLGCLRELGRRAERLALLERVTNDNACDPVMFAHFAQELRADAREHNRSAFFCRRALRRQPMDANNLGTRADLLWDQRRFTEALEYYRLAACLEDKKEACARSYFIAARHLRQTEHALDVLRARFERFAKRSVWPTVTLFESLDQLERTPDAFAVLDRALELRPGDGDLVLFAAEANARHARIDESAKYLEQARTVCRRATWLRTAGRLANLRNDRPAELECWRELIQLEPTATDAHRHTARLLAETQSREAALKHLQSACEKFPHNFALSQLRLEWRRDEGAAEWEDAARVLIAIHPADAWALRELALALGMRSCWPEALAAADEAVLHEPTNSISFSVRGALRRDSGARDLAASDFREAIKLSVDNGAAIDALLKLLPTLEQKQEALKFIQSELERQVVFGESLLAFRDTARGILSAEELCTCLQAALDARPDLWHAWSARINQAIDMRDLETADALAIEATERFPLLPRLWLDHAQVYRALARNADELNALKQAVATNPDWALAARQVASAQARAGDFESARHTMERACVRMPLDPENHVELAQILWSLQQRDDALRELKAAIELNPGFEWFWNLLTEWARELDQPGLPLQMAHALISRRGGEARSWIILARMMHGREELNKVLATLDCAIERSPLSSWAYDVRAEILALAGQKDAALKACCAKIWNGHPPLDLQARAAWIEAHFGKLDVAIAQMQKLLKDHPDYYQGWKTLADWLWNSGHESAAINATDRMADLAPFDPIPLGYRAAMKLRKRDRDGAKKDLERALRLSPDYAYAANNLFEIYLEERDLDAAGQVLEVMRQHQNRDQAIACQLKLQARRAQTRTGTQQIPPGGASSDSEKSKPPPLPSNTWLTGEKLQSALDSFRSLCTSKADNSAPLEDACRTLIAAGVAGEVESILNEMIDRAEAHPHVGSLWVQRQVVRKHRGLREKLMALRQRGEIGRRAIITYVSCLGEAGEKTPLLHLLDENSDWLAKDDWGWEATTIALGTAKQWGRLVTWAREWRDRTGAHPAALHFVMIALQKSRHHIEAAELACAVGERGVSGRGYEPILAWAALEHAIADRLDSARAALEKIRREELNDYSHRIQRMARAVVTLQTTSRDTRAQGWKEADGLMARATNGINILKSDRAFRRAFLRSNTCMARVGRRPQRAVWAVGKIYGAIIGGVGLVVLLLGVAVSGAVAGAFAPALIAAVWAIRFAASRK